MHEERYTAWRDTVVGDACVRLVKVLVVVAAAVAAVAVITRVSPGSTSRAAGIHSAGTDRVHAYHDGQFGRSGPDGGAMISTSAKRTLVVLACLAATASLASCGGDDGPDLPPKPTATDEASSGTDPPTPSGSTPTPTAPATSSAPPGGADLDRAQESAYGKAVQNFDAANKLIFAMYANPQPNQATADQIKTVSYNPFSERVFVEIQRYKRAGVRLEGQPTVKWRRPVSVELDGSPRPSVVWEQCASLSSVRVLKGDRELAQDPAFKRVRITQNADASGRWLVSDNMDAGSCD